MMAAGLPAFQASATETMPLDEVRPGMQATVRTVFEGSVVEEFGAEIVTVMEDFLGPGHDLILARLKGPRVEFTGVAAGMSGSPVYVDGRLIGALAYRMGAFMKEPIAGITPIEYMLRVGEAAGPGAPAGIQPVSAPGAWSIEPIDTPAVLAGVPQSVLQEFAPDLARLGLGSIMHGAAAWSSSGSGAGGPPASLQPGEAVAAQLVSGDIALAATGTVTHVDGDRVYAFGHPALVNGVTDIPMARAEIYLTLSSMQASTKLSRVLEPIGTFHQSRLPAMTGVMGPVPRMIPMRVEVSSESAPPRSYRYELASHRDFTPPLMGLLTAASLVNTSWFADEMTLSLTGRIRMEGHEDLVLEDLFTGFSAAQSAALALARDVQGLFGAVYQNRFEAPRVTSIEMKVTSVEQSRLAIVEAVYPTRVEAEPGQTIEFRVLLRPFRGEHITRTFRWQVPEGTPEGPVNVVVGGANVIGAAERTVLARRASQVDDLGQVISLINGLRTNDKLYLKINRRHAGAVVQNEVLPALPPSIYATLHSGRGTGQVTPLAETTIHEDSIALPQIIIGGTVIPISIR
ncbi:MAG TPA: SpoIVB peptidase S55 domain-containing protein [Candidatus Polarisedimenticolia bacterium]|nr:SpoIVB peptidase S55 domain-containing protein [Candidatus Polarisedimenticolia bacterium]